MDIINITCAEIQTPVGFVYVVLPVIMNHTNNPDCEQSWHLEDGSLIVDPSDPQRLIDPVISVSSDRLVTSLCVNLNYQIICDSADGSFSHEIKFRVRNETAVTPNSDHFWWILAVFIIALLIIILICLMKRKRIFRDPESGVRMRFNTS
ncbi:hypothetical protein QQF64_025966 [Cirrhinus molitorella]|uniref:Uncharacterized protein n=1 Tax=Cirrhinus molitorella TaxID=172907 RepID=A0ABR3NRK8_9TELE